MANAGKSSGSKRSSKAAADSRAEQSIQSFRDALDKSVTEARDLLQEVVDDAVKRGRMTRRDGEELVGRVITRSREQAQEIRAQLDQLASQVREAGSAAGSAASNPRRTATRAADRAKRELGGAGGRGRTDIGGRAKKVRKRAVKAADQPLATADRARRRARLPGFPITAYDQLNVPQIDRRLGELTRAELRRIRTYEQQHKARKGVLRAVDRKLDSSS